MPESDQASGPSEEQDESSQPQKADGDETEKKPDDPLRRLFDLIDKEGPTASDHRETTAAETLKKVVDQHDVAAKYNVLILFDEGSLIRSDADRIYSAIRTLSEKRDILLVLYSSGGEVEPGYLISPLCRESAKKRFVVAVPRRAKSAATLICCGADEIHMGPMSELGPIDPQIGNHPALGLGNALRHIATIVAENPPAASMFAEYMAMTVRPIDLGYYERVVESAAQYAERLLSSHARKLDHPPADIAHTLVYEYKDHGFVIDRQEARRILGEKMIHEDTPEYSLANAIYEHLNFLAPRCWGWEARG